MEQARRVVLVGPDGRQWAPRFDAADSPWTDSLSFKGPFPEKTELRLDVPADLADDAGRTPVNAARFPLTVKMEAFPPLAKFPARFGILEANADPALPVTVRNLEPQILAKMLNVSGSPKDCVEWMQGRILRVPPSRVADILPWLRRVGDGRARQVGVRAAPIARGRPSPSACPSRTAPRRWRWSASRSPAPASTWSSSRARGSAPRLLGKPQPMYVPAAALVTNLAVHFKWGGERSLVWVTTLDTAQPVADARVAVHDCAGEVLWSGRTDAPGPGAASRALPRAHGLSPRAPRTTDFYEARLGLARTAGSSSPRRAATTWPSCTRAGIRASRRWRFRLPTTESAEPAIAHTILDRPLFRAGETVQHEARDPPAGAARPRPGRRRTSGRAASSIRHLGSDEKYELPLAWDAGGIAESAWPIPRSAKLGTYEVMHARARPRATSAPASSHPARFRSRSFACRS